MTKTIPIAETISRKIFHTMAANTLIQLIVVLVIMSFLSYDDARKRGSFLAESNQNSLGLMISTGDYFQLHNVLQSFRSRTTPYTKLVTSEGQDTIFDNPESNIESPKNFPSIITNGGQVLLFTSHPIHYNNNLVGKLILGNRIVISDWIIICLTILSISIATFFFQTRNLKTFALSLGENIINLGSLFKTPENEDNLNKMFADRVRSNILEVEELAENIRLSIIEQIRASNLRRDAAIGRIIAHLSHDLRAPLGTFERLLNIFGERLGDMNSQVRDSLNRLYSMIEALRNSESENLIQKSATCFNVNFASAALSGKAEARNISLTIDTTELPKVVIDSIKVERAWMNLASNAIEFANSIVRIEFEMISEDLFIRIVDDGPGVPEEFVPKLFQRGSTYGKTDGTGLGLAYVRQIMRGHGGDVSYKRDGDLTIFECRLPKVAIEKEDYPTKYQSIEEVKEVKIMLKRVAICFTPQSLSKSICAELTSRKSEKYFFSNDYENADIVATNDPELALAAAEDGKIPLELSAKLSESIIIDRLSRRFNLV